jgi:hypothetical protein
MGLKEHDVVISTGIVVLGQPEQREEEACEENE